MWIECSSLELFGDSDSARTTPVSIHACSSASIFCVPSIIISNERLFI
jgi:hypothetical protein